MINREIHTKVEKILLTVQSPARYIGGELNTFVPGEDDMVRAAICYPDLYEVGMANTGVGILYNVGNAIPGVSCERVFAVAPDFESALRENDIPLYTLESFTPLGDLDLLAFNVAHELLYTNILQILDLGKIPLLRKDRGEGDPIVVAGGGAVSNPFPAFDFIDLFFLGEGEEGFQEKLEIIKGCKSKSSMTREEIIKEISKMEGILNPRNYSFEYHGLNGLAVNIENAKRVRVRKHPGLLSAMEKPMVPNMRISQERAVVEVARGCSNLCKFCHAGFYNLPYRSCTVGDVKSSLYSQLKNTGYNEVSFNSLSVSDYRELTLLLNDVLPDLTERGISVSLPSLKIDKNTLPIVEILSKIRRSSLTFAIESASTELRSISNKRVRLEDVLDIAQFVFSHGWRLIKFYFMIGLAGCDEVDEAEEIANLVKEVLAVAGKGKREINITVSPFIPKPHTPFQWEEQKGEEYLMATIRKIKSLVPRSVRVKNHDTRSSFLEGIIARGDERVGKLLLRAYELGARLDSWNEYFNFRIWEQAMEEVLPEHGIYFSRRDRNSHYPWQVIDTGSDRIVEKMADRKLDLEKYRVPENRYGTPVETAGVMDAMERFAVKYETAAIYRFEFEKVSDARFIPHLDLMEIVKRALRMAGFPMAFSQGFNKREKVSAGFPVPLGIESRSELFDFESYIELDEETISQYMDSVNERLPENISLLGIVEKRGKGALMAAISFIDYEIIFSDEGTAASFIDKLWEMKTFTKKNKKGREVVVQKDECLKSASLRGNGVILSLFMGSASSMRIDKLFSAVHGVPFETAEGIRIVKTGQFSREGNREGNKEQRL